MDYYDAKHYLDSMPLPMFIVDKRTGCILHTNSRAKIKNIRNGDNISSIFIDKAAFLRMTESNKANTRTANLRIDNTAYRAQLVVCDAMYKGVHTLLVTVTSLIEAQLIGNAEAIAQICEIYTNAAHHNKARSFLCASAQSAAAFCATLYEKRNKRYVMKEEWRKRKSVYVPLLTADFESDVSIEAARLRTLKSAADAVCIPYIKAFGTQGAVVYYFDSAMGEQARARIENCVDIMVRLSPDVRTANAVPW